MEINKMKFRSFTIILLVTFSLLSACSPAASGEEADIPDPLPCGERVEWDLAVRILNQGEVEQVVQLHSLEVRLILEDGCEIVTTEPAIDDIFLEVEKCGTACEGMILATE